MEIKMAPPTDPSPMPTKEEKRAAKEEEGKEWRQHRASRREVGDRDLERPRCLRKMVSLGQFDFLD